MRAQTPLRARSALAPPAWPVRRGGARPSAWPARGSIVHHHQLDHPGRRPSRPRNHPSTSQNPGEPEAAQNVIFNAPTAFSATPTRSPSAPPLTSPSTSAPPNSQAGLITVYANYEGNPTTCSAPRRSIDLEPRRADRALRLHRPDPRHPDRDPGHGPHRSDYGLRFTVAEHHPADAACWPPT